MFLTFPGRECPELGCEVVFADAEWKSVWRIATRSDLPSVPPPLGEFMRLVAELGGYNNRRGEPRPRTIWTGLRRLNEFSLAWQTFGHQSHEKENDAYH